MSARPPISARGERGWRDWVTLGVLVAVWGSSFAVNKIAVETISPQWVVALRMGVAALVLVPLLYARGGKMPSDPRVWLWLAWLAVIGNTAPFWLISWGTQHIASGLAGILMAMTPLAVIVLSHFALADERLTPAKAGGFVVGFAGVIMLLGPQNLLALSAQGLAFWSQIAVLGAAMLYAVFSVSARRMPPLDHFQLAAGVSLLGAVIALITAVITSPDGLADMSGASLASSIALGLFPTALAAILLFALLASAGAGFVSMSNYLIPGVAAILGTLVLSEELPARTVAGLGLILAGIAIAEVRFRRPPS